MRLGKGRHYFIKPRNESYADKEIRVLYYEFANKEEYKDTILFTHEDIERLIRDHLENESYNDKNMVRHYSDFWRKLNKLVSLLERIKEERKRELRNTRKNEKNRKGSK